MQKRKGSPHPDALGRIAELTDGVLNKLLGPFGRSSSGRATGTAGSRIQGQADRRTWLRDAGRTGALDRMGV